MAERFGLIDAKTAYNATDKVADFLVGGYKPDRPVANGKESDAYLLHQINAELDKKQREQKFNKFQTNLYHHTQSSTGEDESERPKILSQLAQAENSQQMLASLQGFLYTENADGTRTFNKKAYNDMNKIDRKYLMDSIKLVQDDIWGKDFIEQLNPALSDATEVAGSSFWDLQEHSFGQTVADAFSGSVRS